jgi:hypothetical protein
MGSERSGRVSFEEALAEYGRLRQAYNSGQLGAQDFAQRVQQIQVRDTSGNYWAIDGASGGWLRYDGSSWVPGQPPITQQGGGMPATQIGTPQVGGGYGQQSTGGFGQQPQQQGGFGTPQQGGYGAQQQGGYGAQPQGGYAQPQQQYGVPQQPVAPVQPVAGNRSRRGLLIGCAAAIGVLLVFCVAAIAISAATGNSILSALGGTTGITEAATARSVDNESKPQEKATEFTTGEKLFITFKANNVKAGQYVDLKMFRDNAAVDLDDARSSFDKDATYNGYFSYEPSQTGSYRVELFFNGESTPSQTVNFTVR